MMLTLTNWNSKEKPVELAEVTMPGQIASAS
jgi:hypothetical protein